MRECRGRIGSTSATRSEGFVSIWCAGSSEKVYAAVKTAPCPKCGKIVDLTRQGHIKPHIELKTASATTAK
jgi:hypothetical protein